MHTASLLHQRTRSHRLSALLLLPFALLLVACANTSSPSAIQAGCSTTSSLQGARGARSPPTPSRVGGCSSLRRPPARARVGGSSLGGDWRPTLLSLWLLAGYAALLAIPPL